jgi:hypothetical protein
VSEDGGEADRRQPNSRPEAPAVDEAVTRTTRDPADQNSGKGAVGQSSRTSSQHPPPTHVVSALSAEVETLRAELAAIKKNASVKNTAEEEEPREKPREKPPEEEKLAEGGRTAAEEEEARRENGRTADEADEDVKEDVKEDVNDVKKMKEEVGGKYTRAANPWPGVNADPDEWPGWEPVPPPSQAEFPAEPPKGGACTGACTSPAGTVAPHVGGDAEDVAALRRAAAARSFQGEIIVFGTTADDVYAQYAHALVLNLEELGLRHHMAISTDATHCAKLKEAMQETDAGNSFGCVWWGCVQVECC